MKLLEDVLSKRKIVWWILFIAYCGFIVWMTLVGRESTTSRIEPRPFWAVQELVVGGSEGMKGIVWYLENILLFVPFGFLLSLVEKNWKTVVLTGAVVSVCIELIQYFTAVGLAEFDDITANTIGTVIGFLLWKLMKKVVESHRE